MVSPDAELRRRQRADERRNRGRAPSAPSGPDLSALRGVDLPSPAFVSNFRTARAGGAGGIGGTRGGGSADYLIARTASRRQWEQEQRAGGFLGFLQEVVSNRAVMGALSVLDAPRRLVTSTIKEVADGFSGEGFSAGDWWDQFYDINKQIGVGDYVDTGNIWLDRAMGFVGDVALDPLTYVTFGTSAVVKKGATGLAREAFQASARLAGDAAQAGLARQLDDIGAQLIKRGYTSLDNAQWETLNRVSSLDLRGGARLNIGRTKAGRAVAKTLTVGKRDSLSWAVGGERASRLIGKTAFAPLGQVHKLRAARLGRKILGDSFASGDRAAIRAELNALDTDSIKLAFHALDSTNIGRGKGKAFASETAHRWHAIANDLHSQGIKGSDVTAALDGNQAAIQRIGQANFERVRAFTDELVDHANAAALRQGEDAWLVARSDWFPKKAGDGFQTLLDAARMGGRKGRKAFTEAGFEQEAGIVAGAEFMGIKLVEGAEHPQGLGVVEQAWQRFVEVSGEMGGVGRASQWFNDDIFESMPAYLSMLSKRVGEQRTLSEMRLRGVARDVWEQADTKLANVADMAEFSKRSAQARKFREEAARLEAEEAVARGDLEEAARKAEEAKKYSDRAGNVAAEAQERAERIASAGTDLAVRQGDAVAIPDVDDEVRHYLTGLRDLTEDKWMRNLADIADLVVNDPARHSADLVWLRNAPVAREGYRHADGIRQLEQKVREFVEEVAETARKQQVANTNGHVPKELQSFGSTVARMEREIIELEDRLADIAKRQGAGEKAVDDMLVGAVAARQQIIDRASAYLDELDDLAAVRAARLADEQGKAEAKLAALRKMRNSRTKNELIAKGKGSMDDSDWAKAEAKIQAEIASIKSSRYSKTLAADEAAERGITGDLARKYEELVPGQDANVSQAILDALPDKKRVSPDAVTPEGTMHPKHLQAVIAAARSELNALELWRKGNAPIPTFARDGALGDWLKQVGKHLSDLENRRFGLEELHQRITDTWARLAQEDADSAVRWLTDINVPRASNDGYLRLTGPDGSETNLWFPHKGREARDLSSESMQADRAAADAWLGETFVHDPREAARMGGPGGAALDPVAIRANNPRVYAADDILQGHGVKSSRAVVTRGGYGSARGPALTQMQNDMFLDAVNGSYDVTFRSGVSGEPAYTKYLGHGPSEADLNAAARRESDDLLEAIKIKKEEVENLEFAVKDAVDDLNRFRKYDLGGAATAGEAEKAVHADKLAELEEEWLWAEGKLLDAKDEVADLRARQKDAMARADEPQARSGAGGFDEHEWTTRYNSTQQDIARVERDLKKFEGAIVIYEADLRDAQRALANATEGTKEWQDAKNLVVHNEDQINRVRDNWARSASIQDRFQERLDNLIKEKNAVGQAGGEVLQATVPMKVQRMREELTTHQFNKAAGYPMYEVDLARHAYEMVNPGPHFREHPETVKALEDFGLTPEEYTRHIYQETQEWLREEYPDGFVRIWRGGGLHDNPDGVFPATTLQSVAEDARGGAWAADSVSHDDIVREYKLPIEEVLYDVRRLEGPNIQHEMELGVSGHALNRVVEEQRNILPSGAVRNKKALSPAKIAGAARTHATGVLAPEYGKTGRWKGLWEDLAQVHPHDTDGVAGVFYAHFGDMFSKHMSKRFEGVSRERWVMNRVIDDAFGPNGFASPRHKAEAAELFSKNLRGQGFDSVLYTGRDGNWGVIPLLSGQAENARYVDVDDFQGFGTIQGKVTRRELEAGAANAQMALAKRVHDSQVEAYRQLEPDFGPLGDVEVPTSDNTGKIRDWVAQRRKERGELDLARTSRRGGVIEVSGWEVEDQVEFLLDTADTHHAAYDEALDAWKRGQLDDAAMDETAWRLSAARVAEYEALAEAKADDLASIAAKRAKYERAATKAEFKARVAQKQSEKAWKRAGHKLASRNGTIMFENVLNQWTKIDDELQVPEFVARGLADQQALKFGSPDANRLLRTFDYLTNLFKGYAVMTPGFHSRNLFGGMFNNHLAGVDPGVYRTFYKPWRRFDKALKTMDHEAALQHAVKGMNPEDALAFRWTVEDGHVGGMGMTSEIAGTAYDHRSWNPASTDFRGIAYSRDKGTKVESFLRGSLAFDRIREGRKYAAEYANSAEAMQAWRMNAIDDVAKFHFDYEDLSEMERNVFRRIIPFYTWTRKNLPLQVEMMLTKPSAYNRYTHLKRNMELGQEDYEFLPEYVREQLHIRLPFDSGDGPVYWVPDLPFREMTRSVNPMDLAASANPVIRAPIETALDSRFFNGRQVDYGHQPVRGVVGEIINAPGMAQAIKAFGLGFDDEETGELVVSSKWQYVMEQNLPMWRRFNELVPYDQSDYDKEKHNDRFLNFLTGLGINRITESERATP